MSEFPNPLFLITISDDYVSVSGSITRIAIDSARQECCKRSKDPSTTQDKTQRDQARALSRVQESHGDASRYETQEEQHGSSQSATHG